MSLGAFCFHRAPRSPTCARALPHDAHADPDGRARAHAETKGCIKVVTGTSFLTSWDGRVTVYADQGTGFENVTRINAYYCSGEVVLDACYPNLKAVRMQNTDTDGWVGSVTFARDKASPYSAGTCTTCTKAGRTVDMLFDGDDPSNLFGRTECAYGKMCDIAVELSEPNIGELAPHFAKPGYAAASGRLGAAIPPIQHLHDPVAVCHRARRRCLCPFPQRPHLPTL